MTGHPSFAMPFTLKPANDPTSEILWTADKTTFWLRRYNEVRCDITERRVRISCMVKGKKKNYKTIKFPGVYVLGTSWDEYTRDGDREELEIDAVSMLLEYLDLLEGTE